MDTTYTVELTETQYAALLDRAAELEISPGGSAPPGHTQSTEGGISPCLR